MFKVIVKFADIMDDNYIYEVGEKFPRKGVKVSDERLSELSTERNKTGAPVIEKVAEEVEVVKEEISDEAETEEKPKRIKSKSK